MATIIRGKDVADHVLSGVKADVAALLARGIEPCLAVILVGDDPASQVYVRKKKEKWNIKTASWISIRFMNCVEM